MTFNPDDASNRVVASFLSNDHISMAVGRQAVLRREKGVWTPEREACAEGLLTAFPWCVQ
jgi:hypothetical protein